MARAAAAAASTLEKMRRRPLRPPFVVLGGWLGCQPRHLKAYEQLYESMGFSVISFIPNPVQVIGCTLAAPTIDTTTTTQNNTQVSRQKRRQAVSTFDNNNKNNDTNDNNIHPPEKNGEENDNDDTLSSMEDLAEDVLNCLRYNLFQSKTNGDDDDDNNYFLYHGFSNGGCFLWKHLRTIMNDNDNDDNDDDTNSLNRRRPYHRKSSSGSTIQSRLRGVVFDSCPAWFDNVHGVQKALRYCTPDERQAVFQKYGSQLLPKTITAATTTINLGHPPQPHYLFSCQELFDFLQNDDDTIPQLYLYSRNDPLSNWERIHQLVNERRQRQRQQSTFDDHNNNNSNNNNNNNNNNHAGNNDANNNNNNYNYNIHDDGKVTNNIIIMEQFWKTSSHCAHLKAHPGDYRRAIRNFVTVTMPQQKSKL